MTERSEWKFLGRVIGTCTGWDGDEDTFVLHDFEPAEGIDLPACELEIAIIEGTFNRYDRKGTLFETRSIIEVLR